MPNNQYEILAKPDAPSLHCWVLPKERAQALRPTQPTQQPKADNGLQQP